MVQDKLVSELTDADVRHVLTLLLYAYNAIDEAGRIRRFEDWKRIDRWDEEVRQHIPVRRP